MPLARTAIIAQIVLLTAPAPSSAQTGISAADGWVRMPAAGDAGAPAFVVVENPTMYDVYLVSAASEAAGAVEFRDAGGKPGTPAVVKEVTVPAYGQLEMTAEGVHLWLGALKRPLAPGDALTITLTTDSGASLSIPVVVKSG